MGKIGKQVAFGELRLSVLPTVYEPAEDSFLLATYASSLSGASRILEIGCGCGIASLSAAKACPKASVLWLDINPLAVECSRQNAAANGISNADFLQSDLFGAVPAGKKFDAILFNPPYLPTTREERLALEDENAAYDGGKSGLEVFSRFVSQAPEFVGGHGKVAAIATSLCGGIEASAELLEEKIGKAQILAQESFFFEKICLMEATSD